MRDPAGGTSGIPWRSLATAIVMIALSTQPVFLTGAVFLQLGEEIGLTPSGLGFLVAGFFLTASLASTPMGHVVARIGWRPAMTVNSVVSGACLLAIALWADSVVTMGVILVVAGAAYGMTNPAANGALAEQARRDRLGVVFGLKHAGIPTSSLIAGLAVPLIVINFGWRWAFAGSLVLIPLSLFLIHTGIGMDRSQNGSVQVEPPSPARLSTARLAWIALALAFSTSSAIYLTTFLVGAAVEAQLSEAQAGLLLFAGSVATIVVRLIVGVAADRTASRGFAFVSGLMAIGAIAFLGSATATGLSFVALVIVAFATGWGWPGVATYTVVNANVDTAAASSAVAQTGTFVGAGLGPILIGVLVENWSFGAGWYVLAGLLAVAAAIFGLAGRMRQPIPSNSS